MSAAVSPYDVSVARQRLDGHIVRTPLQRSPSLTALCGAPIHLKLETRQKTGSFKFRGATNAVRALDAETRRRGLVTASTGNHGRALACAGRAEGARVVVCMSSLVPANKVEAVRGLGADIRIVGRSQDDAQAEVDRLVASDGLTEIPPFDHPAIIAGQGTIGLEIAEDLPAVECVLVPLSGGGLAAGVAAGLKSNARGARVIGVSMARGACMHESLRAGRPVQVEELETLADSLGGGIGLANRHTFEMCKALLDGAVLLSEEEIASGVRHAWREEREMVEGAGAVGIAALLANKVAANGPVAVIVSGRNIEEALHRRIVGAEPAAGSESRHHERA